MTPSTTRGPEAVVVGTSFGGRVHVPALRAVGFDVIALVGQDRKRTERRATELSVPLATTDVAEAVQRASGTCCVTVATPPDAHVAPVLEAIELGAHVLCEKPFATDTTDARRMYDAAAAAGVVALLGCEFRWAPDEALVRRALRDNLIGSPSLATFVQHSSLVADGLPETFNADWWLSAERGGGVLNAAGSHYIDRFRTWLGEVEAVSADLRVVGDRPSSSAEDAYTATIRFESGCLVTIQHCSAVRGKAHRLCRVVGANGSVWLEDGTAWLADAQGERPLEVPDDLRLPPAPPASDDPKEIFTPLELPPYTRLAERFRDLVLGLDIDAAAPPTPTFLDGYRNQLVLDAMRESSRSGGTWVTVPPVAASR